MFKKIHRDLADDPKICLRYFFIKCLIEALEGVFIITPPLIVAFRDYAGRRGVEVLVDVYVEEPEAEEIPGRWSSATMAATATKHEPAAGTTLDANAEQPAAGTTLDAGADKEIGRAHV